MGAPFEEDAPEVKGDRKDNAHAKFVEEVFRQLPASDIEQLWSLPEHRPIKQALEERRQIESNLTPEQLEKLVAGQVALALTADKDRPFAQEKFDAQFPALAAKNREIAAAMISAQQASEPLNESGLFKKDLPQLWARRQSAIQCHGERTPVKEPFVVENSQAEEKAIRLVALRREFEAAKAPFAEVAQLSKKYGVDLHSAVKDGLAAPYFAIQLNEKEIRLPIDLQKNPEKQLQKLSREKQLELEKAYGIVLLKGGETVRKAFNTEPTDNALLAGHAILISRAPFIDELYGLEEAFKVSKTTLDLKKNSGDKLNFCFMSDQLSPGGTAAGEYWTDLRGVPTVVVYKPKDSRYMTTNQDALHNNLTVKEIAIHELAHRHQDLMQWTGMQAPLEISNAMGWNHVYEANGSWVLQCRDQKFYRLENKRTETWRRCDAEGKPLDSAGNPVDKLENAEIAHSHALRDKALVKPASDYFVNPTEMFAEGLTALRGGQKWRADLLTESPVLYALVKKQDQLEIDRHYLEHKKGKAGIRLPDGLVVDATAESRKQVALFELPKIPVKATPELAGLMGWKQVDVAHGSWILSGKNDSFFRYKPGSDLFAHCNEQGDFLNAKGEVVASADLAKNETQFTLRSLLKEPRLFDDVSSPDRMFNDALKLFRGEPISRADLLRCSKEFYDAVKAYDQGQLDKICKEHAPGGKLMRLHNGQVTERTPESEAQLAKFENTLAAPLRLLTPEETAALIQSLSTVLPPLTDWLDKSTTALDAEAVETLKQVDAKLTEKCPDPAVVSGRFQTLEKFWKENNFERHTEETSQLALFLCMRCAVKMALASEELKNGQLESAKTFIGQAKQGGAVDKVQLSTPHVDDAILQEVAGLTGVSDLNLLDAKISDAGMVHLSTFPDLTHLMLGSANIAGPGLAQLGRLKYLSDLTLANKSYNDLTLSSLGRSLQLRQLDLSKTSVTDKFTERINDFPNIDTLSFPAGITGASLRQMTQLEHLTRLSLTGKALDDQGLAELANPHLRQLYLDGTALTDKGLAQLSRFRQLDSLSLEGTDITDAGLAKLKDIRGLKMVALPAQISAAGLAPLLEAGKPRTIIISGDKIAKTIVEDWKTRFPNVRIEYAN